MQPMKERDKIYMAAEFVQKNFIEMRKEREDITLDKVIECFYEKGFRLGSNYDQ